MSLRVSLAPSRERPAVLVAPRALLSPAGAKVILGARMAADALVEPLAPAAHTLFGPRGACLVRPGGPLLVCDTGHHRVLVWRETPTEDHTPADFVIGQRDVHSEGRNARSELNAASVNVPTGIASEGGVVAIADAWNHRVLLWHDTPTRLNQPADVVLGQEDFCSALPNRDLPLPRADTLNWCYGVAIHDGRLFVADTGNRRVLMWEQIPARNGTPADLVLGQPDFTTRNLEMRWPHAVAITDKRLFVADAGTSRVMVYSPPRCNDQPCDFVLGQADLNGAEHNRSSYYPTAASMNMPYGVTAQGDRLIVADTANSRLLGFDLSGLVTGAEATYLSGQSTFVDKGENRWETPSRNTVCWPYSVAACGRTLAIADSGNNRVLLWEAE